MPKMASGSFCGKASPLSARITGMRRRHRPRSAAACARAGAAQIHTVMRQPPPCRSDGGFTLLNARRNNLGTPIIGMLFESPVASTIISTAGSFDDFFGARRKTPTAAGNHFLFLGLRV